MAAASKGCDGCGSAAQQRLASLTPHELGSIVHVEGGRHTRRRRRAARGHGVGLWRCHRRRCHRRLCGRRLESCGRRGRARSHKGAEALIRAQQANVRVGEAADALAKVGAGALARGAVGLALLDALLLERPVGAAAVGAEVECVAMRRGAVALWRWGWRIDRGCAASAAVLLRPIELDARESQDETISATIILHFARDGLLLCCAHRWPSGPQCHWRQRAIIAPAALDVICARGVVAIVPEQLVNAGHCSSAFRGVSGRKRRACRDDGRLVRGSS